MEDTNKNVKKDYFVKNLSSTFFEINTSNFQGMFLAIFRKFCRNRIKKIKNKNFITKKKHFFVYFLNIEISTEFSKYCKEHFPKI